MMPEIDLDYTIREDIGFLLEAEKITPGELSERTGVSRSTLAAAERTGHVADSVLEKIYAYAYRKKYRMNAVKEELLREKRGRVLFHGSKEGLREITATGSRENCDFGSGFYMGETYSQALAFVCEKEKSSVYSFCYDTDGLNIKRFDCNLEWMLAICFFRGRLNGYASNPMLNKITEETRAADAVIAPIADNKMFYIMTQFTEGEINADAALHSLSASKLGLQYVFKTEKALSRLIPVERYYISAPEREDCRRLLDERSYEIDTKLKLAKREFKTGLFVEEILK